MSDIELDNKMVGRPVSLSLCEQLNVRNIARVISNIKAAKSVERIYLGSSFCCRYLFQAANDVLENILDLCKECGIEATLVLPVPAERFCSSMIDFLNDFTAKYAQTITEITCNDYAMLNYCASTYPQKVNIGRLFSKDTREMREPHFTDMALTPSLLERDIDSIFPMDRISCIELDPVHRFQDAQKVPQGINLALYMDWCYQTTGMICEQAATHHSLQGKFRPSSSCMGECQHNAIFYEGQMGFPYYKHGATVYYFQEGARLVCGSNYRKIYSPLLSEIFQAREGENPWDVFRTEAA